MKRLFGALLMLSMALACWSYPLGADICDAAFESLDPPSTKLKSLRGKTLVVALTGRNSFESGHAQVRAILQAFPEQADLIGIVVADLPGVPGFVKGTIVENVVENHKKTSQSLRKLKSNGPKFFSFLDWKGLLAQEVGANGDTSDTYHLLLIDRGLNNRLQIQQKVNGVTEKMIFEEAKAYLEKTLPKP